MPATFFYWYWLFSEDMSQEISSVLVPEKVHRQLDSSCGCVSRITDPEVSELR